MKTMKEIVMSKQFIWATWILAEFMLLAFVFAAGIHVGTRRAHYSYEWGANYERNFIGFGREKSGMRGEIPSGLGSGEIRNASGISGSIVSITDNAIVIKDRKNNENSVATNEKTIIKSKGSDMNFADLKVGSQIVVLGKPGDNGVVNADLIRVFDNTNNK